MLRETDISWVLEALQELHVPAASLVALGELAPPGFLQEIEQTANNVCQD